MKRKIKIFRQIANLNFLFFFYCEESKKGKNLKYFCNFTLHRLQLSHNKFLLHVDLIFKKDF